MHNFTSTSKALQFGGATVYPLLLLGLIALVIILDKAFVYWRYARLPGRLSDPAGELSFPLGGAGRADDVSRAGELFRPLFPGDPR